MFPGKANAVAAACGPYWRSRAAGFAIPRGSRSNLYECRMTVAITLHLTLDDVGSGLEEPGELSAQVPGDEWCIFTRSIDLELEALDFHYDLEPRHGIFLR